MNKAELILTVSDCARVPFLSIRLDTKPKKTIFESILSALNWTHASLSPIMSSLQFTVVSFELVLSPLDDASALLA